MRLPLVLFALLGCSGPEDASLGDATTCADERPCKAGSSCLVGQCVTDGSLTIGGSCNSEQQCGPGLVCHHFICKPGCSDVYYRDDCADDTWCKPVEGAFIETPEGNLPVGSCSPSECDPRIAERCVDHDMACVAIAPDVGACLPYCAFGYVGATYEDSCTDSFQLDRACQPMGLNQVPVCFPAGGETAPAVGMPGCDAVRNPCAAGSICVNVVCRQLCTPAQQHPCPADEQCVPLAERHDVAYCKEL